MNDDVATFQAERAKLESEHADILEAIHNLRKRAREKSLVAADTHQPLAQSEIDHWQRGIREHQTKLMSVQSQLGALNKRIRQEHASNNGSRTRESKLQPSIEEQNHAVFLSCFYQITRDSLDPRVCAALERDAKTLAADFRRMHGRSSEQTAN